MALTDEQHETISNDISNAELNDKRGSHLLFEHTAPCLEDVQTFLEACGDAETCEEYVGQYEKRHVPRVIELCEEIVEMYGNTEDY
tara:strand:- start:706 stop:963 length:258 start_codon:yes stop_codon:yes gene_type:complete